MVHKKDVDLNTFNKFVYQGLNCKQIAKKLGIHPHTFGLKMKQLLGIYPSIYIARLKKKPIITCFIK